MPLVTCSDSDSEPQQASSSADSSDSEVSDSDAAGLSCGDQNSEVSESEAFEVEPDTDNLKRRLKRQAQTSKARIASLLTFARRRMAKNANLNPPEPPAEKFRELVKEDSALNRPSQYNLGWARRSRLRLLVSYLKAWAATLMAFFRSERPLNHVIITAVIDDTNMRLAPNNQDSQVKEWKTSRVVQVMQNIQTLIVNSGDPSGDPAQCECTTFPVHTPLIAMARANRDSICAEFIGRLFLFLGQVGSRFQSFKLAADLAERVPIQALFICWDSLITNISVLKDIRSSVHNKHQSQNGTNDRHVYPVLAVCCLIHQLALSRKCILMGWPHFWSSVVRLGHLFEVQSFRAQFRRAILAEVSESFQYIPIASPPENYHLWKLEHQRICGIVAGASSRHNKKRIELHTYLMRWDNGCPKGKAISHWCNGSCCPGSNYEAKRRFAMLQCCRYFALLFSFGFPIPLTYRWVHCHRALQYLQDARITSQICRCGFLVTQTQSYSVVLSGNKT